MLKNYLKLAWRHLAKNPLYSTLNIAGLAIGMAISFILLLFVIGEYNYDKFNANHDNLYLVFKNQSANGEIKTKPTSPEPLAAALKKDFPEIIQTARINAVGNGLFTYKDRSIKQNTNVADPALLDMFTFDFIAGSKGTPAENAGSHVANVLNGQSLILTRSAAKALFGNENPIGHTVQYNNQYPLTVTAVINDLPANSSISFNALISWDAYVHQNPWIKDMGYGNYMFATYVQLKPGASIEALNKKLKNIIQKYNPADKQITLFLYPLIRLHLYNEFLNGVNAGGRITYVRLFTILAMAILLIACINFMNLSTARSASRAREVGVRKTMGARRFALIRQFLSESILMAILAFTIAIGLTALLLPVFNRLTGIELSLPFDSLTAWTIGLAITFTTGLLAGSWPALFLSSFNPVRVLKGRITNNTSTVKPRQLLVITQFTFATALIIASIFVYKQVNYIKNRPVGYDRYGLVEIPVEGKMEGQFESFRRDAIATGAVTDAAMISAPITENISSLWDVHWPDQRPGEEKIPIDAMGVTWHFLDTYGLQLAEGREFDPGRPGDSLTMLLNEAAVKLMRLKHPLGTSINVQGENRTVIGVVKNFVWGSPFQPVKPAMIGFQKGWVGVIGLRLDPNAPIAKSLAAIKEVYKRVNPEYPFQYSFTDENFARKFDNEKLLGTISAGFTVLAILISCLGLFGLASFSAEQRRKEIGIRKVLGASTGNLWFKLSREFVQLVVIAFLLGSALSGYYIDRWLSAYTYHTTINWQVFALTLFLSITICLAAVSWQAIKAANANPVRSLRSE
jgi:putative ABC transport system permease protein